MDAKSTTERIQAHCKNAQETCKRILDKLEALKTGK